MRIAETEASIISDGSFLLDGGTMFGVIPRPLWARACAPDEHNRIRLGLNCLLVRAPCGPVLIEGGIGRSFSGREAEIYSVSGPCLGEGLAAEGVKPEEIRYVVLTHLHIDHAGAAVAVDGMGRPAPFFKNAAYIVQRQEWLDAMENYGVMKSSYRPDVLGAIEEGGNLKLIDGDFELAPGIQLILTGGHTRGHQAVIIKSGDETIIFPGDIIPTAAHLKETYITSYDLFPMDTLRAKREIISKAENARAIMVFYHEPGEPAGRIELDNDESLISARPINSTIKEVSIWDSHRRGRSGSGT